jgi:hypothetical protein
LSWPDLDATAAIPLRDDAKSHGASTSLLWPVETGFWRAKASKQRSGMSEKPEVCAAVAQVIAAAKQQGFIN